MKGQVKAIALCRVSSDEQLKNNSLARQNKSVHEMANKIGAVIPPEYIWSGSVSSKVGKNMKRKDLNEIYEVCRRDKKTKYIIVDEPDRFMRSIEEAFAWQARFREIGVEVIFTDEQLNGNDMLTKLQRFMKYFQAEGSNEERIHKAKEGLLKDLEKGKYPFAIPRGYKKGRQTAVPEKDEEKADLLQDLMRKIAANILTPSEALVEYNRQAPMLYEKFTPLKMDRWRATITNPFYAGIVEMNKQVKYRNENGLHEPIITKEEHYKIVEIMNNKRKTHKAPAKNGNPLFPLNKFLYCDECCHSHSKYDVFVGVHQGNGKGKYYDKYRCRGCYRSLQREEVNAEVKAICDSLEMTENNRKKLVSALEKIWKQEEGDINKKARSLRLKLNGIEEAISSLMTAYLEEDDAGMKQDIKERRNKMKADAMRIKEEIEGLETSVDNDRKSFVEFALSFVDKLGSNFTELSPTDAEKCKQIIFPEGFRIDQNKNVYTTYISPIYRLRVRKKSALAENFPLWYTRYDSNVRPLAPQANALSN